jgi:nitroreductase
MTAGTVDLTLRRLVELACRAPSIGNSQPWRWSVTGATVDLYADRSRRVPHSDPIGRQLVVSCGAALHHARAAAAALGRPTAVFRLPDPARPDLLATLRTRHGPVTPGALAELEALEARHTDRRRFTSWPVTEDRMVRLAQAIDGPGVQAVAFTDRRARSEVDRLVQRSTGDPRTVVPSDGLLALCTDHDDTLSWLRTGEALSALWLRATTDGLSIVPLSEVVESPDTRERLVDLFGGLVQPQLLVRVGWQEIGARQEQRSPRRPVDEVLELGATAQDQRPIEA